MGLLDQMRQAHVEPEPQPLVVVPTPQAAVAVPTPTPAPAPKPMSKDLKFEREPGTGLIKSVSGIDADGQRVRFDFERDGRRQLQKIKVRR